MGKTERLTRGLEASKHISSQEDSTLTRGFVATGTSHTLGPFPFSLSLVWRLPLHGSVVSLLIAQVKSPHHMYVTAPIPSLTIAPNAKSRQVLEVCEG
jgi:hypothetical protein